MGGRDQSGQAIKLFQITPYVNDHFQQSRFLTACRRLERLLFTFVVPSVIGIILADMKLAELSNNCFE